MILSLELAKEEILYAKDWTEKYKKDPDFFNMDILDKVREIRMEH